jgi:hypothetical protein
MTITTVGGLALLALFYYPELFVFPMLFRKLAWVDLRQVSGVLVAFSLYQVIYMAVTTKNCFLFAMGRPVLAQAGVFCGWIVSLLLLTRFRGGGSLAGIPLCLVVGNIVALLYPSFRRETFFYRTSLLKLQAASLISRTLPITAGTSVTWLEPAIDGVIASTLRQGSLTVYYFFVKVILYIGTVIASGYIQPVTKHLAELAGRRRWRELHLRTNSVAIKAEILGLGLWVCCLLVFLLLTVPHVSVLRGYLYKFSQNFSVFLLLLGYLFGLLGYTVYSNSLYVARRERFFLFASLVTFPAGIVLKLLGARMLGLRGLAVGTSIYWMGYAIALLLCFAWAVKHREAEFSAEAVAPAFQGSGIES